MEKSKGEGCICDKCGGDFDTLSLIWLTSEDFEPKEGEILSKEAEKYDAVCESCYKTLLIIPELTPVVSSGSYACEHENCQAVQTDEDMFDQLYYGKDDGMYCEKHIQEHL